MKFWKVFDFEYFKQYHRELVDSALKIKHECPTCEAQGCQLQCTRCKSVYYCNKACQLTDWPKHKQICNTFNHVVKEGLKTVDGFMDFLSYGPSEIFCVCMLMAGMEAELTFPFVPTKLPSDPGVIYQTAIVEGRIYDIYTVISNKKKCPQLKPVTREIQPLPTDISPLMEFFLTAAQRGSTQSPFNVPDRSTINADDLRTIIKSGARRCIGSHYILHDDKNRLIELYGKKIVEEATGETVEEFRKRMDELITHTATQDEAVDEYLKKHFTYMCNDIYPQLTTETVQKYNPIRQLTLYYGV